MLRRNGGSFSSGELARAYGFTDVDGSRPDCWRYLVEVQEAGKPPDQPATAEAQSGHADVRSRDQRVERCAEGCKRLAADCVADSGPQC
jgi:hypothetical protein